LQIRHRLFTQGIEAHTSQRNKRPSERSHRRALPRFGRREDSKIEIGTEKVPEQDPLVQPAHFIRRDEPLAHLVVAVRSLCRASSKVPSGFGIGEPSSPAVL